MAATLAEGVCDVCRSNNVERIDDTCEVLLVYLFVYWRRECATCED